MVLGSENGQPALERSACRGAGATGCAHKGGVHHSEIAHHRQQATGGFTDALGAVPAATGSNIEDMAAEEGHAKLAKLFPHNLVREVNVARVRGSGEGAGTLDTRERHLFGRSSPSQPYAPVLRHTQDGERNMPDKNEVRAVKARFTQAMPPMASSSSASSSTPSAAAWGISSTPAPQALSFDEHTVNDTSRSVLFSGTRSPGGTWRTGRDGADWVDAHVGAIARGDPHPARTASAQFAHTGRRTPPFQLPPSPPTMPMAGRAPPPLTPLASVSAPPSSSSSPATPASPGSPKKTT